MEPRPLVWLAVCAGLVLALSATAVPGWILGAVAAAALVLAIPLSAQRFRAERNLARTIWRTLPRGLTSRTR
jgi:asparagine N-glycosylation enzyme membrane subunit Stt3